VTSDVRRTENFNSNNKIMYAVSLIN